MKLGWPARVFLWTPRILGFALALFLAMLATDVLAAKGGDFWETSGGFLLHLVPSFCVVAVLIIGWKRDGLAALGFFALGAGYFLALAGWKHLPESLVLTLPPIAIGLAYLARLLLLRQLRPTSEDAEARD